MGSDQSATRLRFVGQGEDPNSEGLLFASSAVRFSESCIRKAVAERGLTPGPAGLCGYKVEDEPASRWADFASAYGD